LIKVYQYFVTFLCTGPVPDDVEIQTMVGEAINRLIKHHHKSLKERVRGSFALFLTSGIFLDFFLCTVFKTAWSAAP
jgi:hypothetical protein